MNGHTDVFGNILAVGDMVACTCWGRGKTTSELMTAHVVGFSKQKIRVKYVDVDGSDKITTKYSNQVSKRYEVNLFHKSQKYLLEILGMPLEDAIETANCIYEEEVSRMDY